MNCITPDIYKNLTLLPFDPTGWNSDRPVFGELIDKFRPKQIIEVGSWVGKSAIHMAGCCKKLGLSTKITCVDTWLGSLEFWQQPEAPERNLRQNHGYPQVYFQFLSNVVHKGHEDMILPFPAPSTIAARYFKASKLTAELVYIDASHEYEDVWTDLNAYWPLATGVMFGDDYIPEWSGVIKAVDRFADENSLKVERVGVHWMLRK